MERTKPRPPVFRRDEIPPRSRNRTSEFMCVSLVGIAGAGKSTLAPMLAQALGWRSMDTDRLIESCTGRRLQSILDELGLPGFMACEEQIVSGLAAARMVVATGGSVVYSERIVERLRMLGPVVWLRISLDSFLARVGAADNRGFVRPEGMSLTDVWRERDPLYRACADLVVDTDELAPEECVRVITGWMLDEEHETGDFS